MTTTSATIYSSVYNSSVVSKLRNVKRTRQQFKDIALYGHNAHPEQNVTEIYHKIKILQWWKNENERTQSIFVVVSDVRIVTYWNEREKKEIIILKLIYYYTYDETFYNILSGDT